MVKGLKAGVGCAGVLWALAVGADAPKAPAATRVQHFTQLRKAKVGQVLELQDRKSTRLNSSHSGESRMPSSA